MKKIGKEIKVDFGSGLNCEINWIAELIAKPLFEISNVTVNWLNGKTFLFLTQWF